MAVSLTKAQVTATDRKKFTFSCWLKRGKISTQENFFTSIHNGSNEFQFRFDSDDEIKWVGSISGSAAGSINTKRVFRDTSGWYNIVIAGDTTQSTNIDRLKLYINGEQIADGDLNSPAYPAQDTNFGFGTTDFNFCFGVSTPGTTNDPFTGIITHAHFIDGTAYDASTFGSTDATTGQWEINTSPTVTYGNNGFFILKNSNSLTDESGNANNFTLETGTLTNTEDNPSNVFATLNAIANNQANTVLTNGNLTHTDTGGSWLGAYTTLGAFTGKFYAEGKITDRMNYSFGVIQSGGDSVANINTPNNNLIGRWNDGWGFNGNNGTTNKKYHNNSTTDPYGEVFADNDIFMIALDVTGGKIYFGRNGTWFDSGDPAAGTNPAFTGETFTNSMHFASGMENGSLTWNFGNGYFGTTAISSEGTNASGIGKFEYDVPTGFTALSTKGLNL
tara:strand:+ start:266 stop:1606 length:1341 start_codon:yes stop_codon:yes gene_type:complete